MKTSRTGTADFTPTYRKTSPTSATVGGKRESLARARSTDRPDRPVNSRDWNHTVVFTVSDNLSPIHRPNERRKTTGGWNEERTGRHFIRMEYHERTVCLPALIHRMEDHCLLDSGIPFSRGTTTAASKSQFGGPLTSMNCELHATHGATRWHSIQKGCSQSQHSAKVQTRSSRFSRPATAFQSDCRG